MANKLDLYDINKLEDARRIIYKVYEYNFKPSEPLSKKLETILKKIDSLIEENNKEN